MTDYREAGHLPKRRDDGRPAPPADLPRQRRGVTPQLRARYPDFDVLEQQDHWDDATRSVVLGRLETPPEPSDFDPGETATLRAFCDTVTAQDGEPCIPVFDHVAQTLAAGKREGYRYAGMPDDLVTWKRSAAGLDAAARDRGAAGFAAADEDVRLDVCSAFSSGELGGPAWEGVDVSTAWSVLMRDTLSAFYAHPWAWNEIGFPGPAYPRGFSRLGVGLSEAWEGEEAFEQDPVRDVQERGLDR